MTKTEYREYLASPHWRELRKDYLSYNAECERCELPRWLANIAYDQDLHVHHKSYASLGQEDHDDLEALCRRCHELKTFGRTSIAAVKSFPCAVCKRPAFDVYTNPADPMLCLTCSPFLSGGKTQFHLPSPNGFPVWVAVLRSIVFALGIDAVLAQMAEIEIRQRRTKERMEKWRAENGGKEPF